MMDCKRALEETGGDIEAATTALRTKGLADAAKRAGRAANEGARRQLHPRRAAASGVLVEVNCETDFVARTDQFKEFVHDVALHIAALKPRYVSVGRGARGVPGGRAGDLRGPGARTCPSTRASEAVEGKLAKHLKSICLLDQEFVRDQGEKTPRTIEAAPRRGRGRAWARTSTIRRFACFELGQ